jgi:RimJ/RimL family protein N-acetyltransferase
MRIDDFDRYAEIWSLPDGMRNLELNGNDRRAAWEAFLRNAGHWQMTGFGQWAIVDQRSREMIGAVGFGYLSEPIDEEIDRFPETNWLLLREAQGSGLALEAVQSAHDWFDRVIPGTLLLRIGEDQIASLKMAERLGYRETGLSGQPYRLLRRDGPPGRR